MLKYLNVLFDFLNLAFFVADVLFDLPFEVFTGLVFLGDEMNLEQVIFFQVCQVLQQLLWCGEMNGHVRVLI